jgi:hypothetical protein
MHLRHAWPVLMLVLALPLACSKPSSPLDFIADDYPGALAAARARGAPLFAELWAPW